MSRLLFLLLLIVPAQADDWPQWMGPDRDNQWKETGLLEKFPEGGPKVVWRSPIAGGYSGPAVVGGKVFVTDYVTSDNVKVGNFERQEFTGTERVLCLDEATGKEIWKHEYPVKYSVSYPSGPRCTPNVDGAFVYSLGSEGHLFCFKTSDGSIVWSKQLKQQYKTKAALWGYAAHPLIDGDNLLTLAGGEGSHIVALNKLTGDEVWRSSTSREQGYSPPTIIEYADARQLILLKPDSVSAVDPADGSEYWSVPYDATSGSIIMSPVMVGQYLYAAGYSSKNLLLKMNGDQPGVSEVWRDKRNMISPVNVQPIVIDDVVYGFDQKGVLRAIRIPDGEKLWETSDVVGKRASGSDTALFVRQADRCWFFTELGDLVIGKLSPDGYEEIDRANVIKPTNLAFGRDVVWSMPAFANRRVYIRNDEEMICVDLAAGSE
ncbi:MAG: PQQ-binding-like beta-propeller repeat protein [Fuerstiella sp.]